MPGVESVSSDWVSAAGTGGGCCPASGSGGTQNGHFLRVPSRRGSCQGAGRDVEVGGWPDMGGSASRRDETGLCGDRESGVEQGDQVAAANRGARSLGTGCAEREGAHTIGTALGRGPARAGCLRRGYCQAAEERRDVCMRAGGGPPGPGSAAVRPVHPPGWPVLCAR